jgi:hypothetical protein
MLGAGKRMKWLIEGIDPTPATALPKCLQDWRGKDKPVWVNRETGPFAHSIESHAQAGKGIPKEIPSLSGYQ